MIQYPVMSSLVSAKGPSMTVRLTPENLMRAPLEPGAIEEYAGFHQLLVVLADRGKEIFARHDACFRVLAGLHNHHESHGHVSFNFYVERGTAKSTRRIVCLTWLPPWGRRDRKSTRLNSSHITI